ncbi:MAG: sigma-70 family RNA polymerase sigma factor [Planctomycetota bacterium]
MRRTLKKLPKKKTASRAASAAAQEPATLSAFADLEVPVRALLSFEEEAKIGARIHGCLRRLARILPHHPEAYRRYVARMEDVTTGGPPVFSWFPLGGEIERDVAAARRCLERAESLAAASPARALKAYAEGVAIVAKYPLNPETLEQWAREVSGKLRSSSALDRMERFQRIDRIVGEVARLLTRERDRLVVPNFRLVLKEVFRYRPVGMKRSDLFQEGVIGLHKAVFRFDATKGIRFSTYATYWIRQSIRKCLTDKSRLIRVPQAVQEELRKPESGLDPTEAARLRRILGGTVLFSHSESEDSKDRFAFEIPDPSAPQMGESLRLYRMPQAVQDALLSLDSRHRDVVQRRFGLAGERPQTLEEIGAQLNLSRERIRQIEQEALAAMRQCEGLQELYEDLELAAVTVAETHN